MYEFANFKKMYISVLKKCFDPPPAFVFSNPTMETLKTVCEITTCTLLDMLEGGGGNSSMGEGGQGILRKL